MGNFYLILFFNVFTRHQQKEWSASSWWRWFWKGPTRGKLDNSSSRGWVLDLSEIILFIYLWGKNSCLSVFIVYIELDLLDLLCATVTSGYRCCWHGQHFPYFSGECCARLLRLFSRFLLLIWTSFFVIVCFLLFSLLYDKI